jgi:hypothetical protein
MADKRNKGRKLQAAGVEADWLSQLANNMKMEFAPPGWYTLNQVAERLGIGRTAAKSILAHKKALKQKFCCKLSDGRNFYTMHYKL